MPLEFTEIGKHNGSNCPNGCKTFPDGIRLRDEIWYIIVHWEVKNVFLWCTRMCSLGDMLDDQANRHFPILWRSVYDLQLPSPSLPSKLETSRNIMTWHLALHNQNSASICCSAASLSERHSAPSGRQKCTGNAYGIQQFVQTDTLSSIQHQTYVWNHSSCWCPWDWLIRKPWSPDQPSSTEVSPVSIWLCLWTR